MDNFYNSCNTNNKIGIDYVGPAPSNANDDEITVDDKLCYSKSLFYTTSDLHQVQSYDRQFYSNPTQQPLNSQTNFALWLYGNRSSGKENNNNFYFQ